MEKQNNYGNNKIISTSCMTCTCIQKKYMCERETMRERERRERASNRKLICNWSAKYIKYSMII